MKKIAVVLSLILTLVVAGCSSEVTNKCVGKCKATYNSCNAKCCVCEKCECCKE